MNLLTTRDVQSLIKVDRSTIYRMAEGGRIPAVKVGRQWRFPEDRLHDWLHRQEPGDDAPTVVEGALLGDLIAPGSLQAVADLLAEATGVMVVVTDMGGRPLTEVANPCGLFRALHAVPGVLEHCVAGWQAFAGDLDMEPRWKATPLGFLCARSLIRVGDQLKGMILAGGIEPESWPPHPDEAARLAAGLGVPGRLLRTHADGVYRLDPGRRDEVIRLLTRSSVLLSRLAGESAGARRSAMSASSEPQRSER